MDGVGQVATGVLEAGNPPLLTVAEVALDRGSARIHRIDGLRTVTVEGDVDPRITTEWWAILS